MNPQTPNPVLTSPTGKPTGVVDANSPTGVSQLTNTTGKPNDGQPRSDAEVAAGVGSPSGNNLNPVKIESVTTGDANQETVNKGPYTLERIKFNEGKKKGFSYWLIQFTKLEDAVTKYGEGVVMGMLNGFLRSSSSGRATQRMPSAEKEEDTKKLIESALLKGDEETTLISQEDAEKWVPGTRDKVSLIGLQKEFLEACKAGNAELAAELSEQIKVEQDKKMAEMLAGLTAPTA